MCINLIGFKNLKGFKEFSPDRNKMMNEGNDNRILKIKNKIIPKGFKNRICNEKLSQILCLFRCFLSNNPSVNLALTLG